MEQKEILLKEATIVLRTDGILHVVYTKGMVLDVPLQEHMVTLFLRITEGKKVPILFEAMPQVTITAEARHNAINLEKKAPSIAYAVVADNLPYRLIANFYMKVNRPTIPYRVFPTREKALEWLKTFL